MAAKILVVDDDPNVQRLLQYTLKQEGYDVVVASDGSEGFRLWGAEAPDLILLDVQLPKLDGYQVATKIRTEEGTSSHVPIIMLTAEREVEQKVRGLRVFLDLGLDRKSIVDVVTAPSIDADLIKQVMVKHDSGIDLLLAPPTPETAELVRPEHLPFIAEQLSRLYDYTLIDIDKRLDDVNLGVFEAADAVFVVMTADLSCLKNVRLILETMEHLGYPADKVQLVLNRSNAFTGINVKNAEGALKRTIDHQVVNEYRGAISALNSGAPFMFTKADSVLGGSVLNFARSVDTPAAAAKAKAAVAR